MEKALSNYLSAIIVIAILASASSVAMSLINSYYESIRKVQSSNHQIAIIDQVKINNSKLYVIGFTDKIIVKKIIIKDNVDYAFSATLFINTSDVLIKFYNASIINDSVCCDSKTILVLKVPLSAHIVIITDQGVVYD